MAFRWRADYGPKLKANVVAFDFKGIGTSIAKNLYFCNFRGGSGPPVPHLDPYMHYILLWVKVGLTSCWFFSALVYTQVNRMSRSRRVLATGGKQRIFWLDMACIETILFHLDSFWGIRTTYRSIVYRIMITLKSLHVLELTLFEFKSHLNSEMR